jgi:hypothetical protein
MAEFKQIVASDGSTSSLTRDQKRREENKQDLHDHLCGLPNELLLQIATYARESLSDIALSCKILRPIAENVLYRSVKLFVPYSTATSRDSYRILLLTQTLVLNEDLAKNVHELSLHCDSHHEFKAKVFEKAICKRVIMEGERTFNALSTHNNAFSTEAAHNWRQKILSVSSWITLLLCIVPKLQDLTLGTIDSTTLTPSTTPFFYDQLDLNTVEDIFELVVKNRNISLIPSLRQIRSLRLIAKEIEHEWFTLPCLEKLQLGMDSNFQDNIKNAVRESKISTMVLKCTTDLMHSTIYAKVSFLDL